MMVSMPMNARVLHQLVDRTENGVSHAAPRQGGGLVVVDAENARAALGRIQAAQQALRDRSGADDGDDLAEASGAVPYPHLVMQDDTARRQQHDAAREPKGDPWPVHRGQRLDQERGEEQGSQRQQPAEQRTADGGAQIGELVEAIGARKVQKIQAEQRTQKNDQTFEAPVDGGGVPLHGDDAGAEDGDAVESRHEFADDRFRHGAATPRRAWAALSVARSGRSSTR